MPSLAKLNKFLETICGQIRWKKAHNVISEEIRNHVIDQKNALVKEGLDDEIAMERAIKEMGDPLLIGRELDKTHRPRMEWSIFFLTGLMLILGFILRYIASLDTGTPFMLGRSLMTTLIGAICMVGAYYIDFTFIGRYPKSIFTGLTGLSILSMFLLPLIRGRYLYVQFILLIFPTVMAGILYQMRNKGYMGIILSGAFFLIPVFIGLRTASIGLVVLISLSFLILITMAVIKGWFKVNKLYGMFLIYLATFSAVIVGFIRIMSHSYERQRLFNMINPYKDPLGNGYISIRMREILAGAKFIGRGDLGTSGYMIPEINTNYIMTFLIHRLGWISFIAIIGLISFLIIRSFSLSLRQKSILGKLISTAVLLTFTMEVVLYIITNLGLPLIGSVTLPFISYSGMSTVVNMFLIGIMLSVFKSGHMVKDSFVLPYSG